MIVPTATGQVVGVYGRAAGGDARSPQLAALSGGDRMVRLIRGVGLCTFVAWFGVSAALIGCASAPEQSSPDAEGVGSIGLELQVGGAALNEVSYTIVGPGSYTKSGTLNVAQSTVLSAVLAGIPVGRGYTITL